MSLLSSIEAKILRYFVSTSGNGGHLQCIKHPDVGECSHSLIELPDAIKVGVALEIVLLSNIEAEILHTLFYFYLRFLAAIFDLRLIPTLHNVYISAICSSITKLPVWCWNSRSYLLFSLIPTFFKPASDIGYGCHLDYQFGYSHRLYITDALFRWPTVQYKAHRKSQPVLKIDGSFWSFLPLVH